jgi:hypothetical protein
MYHLQQAEPGWTDSLPHCPDYTLIKAFDPGLLADGYGHWTAAGRDPARLVRLLRHFDDHWYPRFEADPQNWDWHVALWRRNFATVIDKTFLDHYAPVVQYLETLNEHTDTRMVADKALLSQHLLTEQAAVWVWNHDYRTRSDLAHIRPVIVNSPEGNDIPVEFYQLAVAEDAVLGCHPYQITVGGQAPPGEFHDVSGRWNTNELQYGLYPDYAFTESGPLGGPHSDGWREGTVCAGNTAQLVERLRVWVRQVKQTAAYRQGRIIGTPAVFTTGHLRWETFQLSAAQLNALAAMFAAEWSIPMTDQAKLQQAITATQTLIGSAQALLADLQALAAPLAPPAHAWQAGEVAVAVNGTLQLYDGPNGNVSGPLRQNVTYNINVMAVSPDGQWLQVFAGMWAKAADLKPMGS